MEQASNQAFAGRSGKPTLATHAGYPIGCRQALARKILPQAAERLQTVLLENLPWERFLKLYDTPETFFFVDPPYLGHNAYRHNFKMTDFEALAAALKKMKGRFLMTHTDNPEIRALFDGLNFEPIEIRYLANRLTQGSKSVVGQEVLISNY